MRSLIYLPFRCCCFQPWFMASLNQMTQHSAYKPWKYTSASEKNDERVECRRSLRGSISHIRRERERPETSSLCHAAAAATFGWIIHRHRYTLFGSSSLSSSSCFLLFGILVGFYLVLPKIETKINKECNQFIEKNVNLDAITISLSSCYWQVFFYIFF